MESLKLRIVPRMWGKVEAKFDLTLQDFLNGGDGSQWLVGYNRNGRMALTSGRYIFMLSKPPAGCRWDYDLCGYRHTVKDDYQGGVQSAHIATPIQVFGPSEAANLTGPASWTPPTVVPVFKVQRTGETVVVGVAVNGGEYDRLAAHNKAEVNHVWTIVKRQADTIRRVPHGQDTLFQLIGKVGKAELEELNETLQRTGTGRTFTDWYELTRLARLIAESGEVVC